MRVTKRTPPLLRSWIGCFLAIWLLAACETGPLPTFTGTRTPKALSSPTANSRPSPSAISRFSPTATSEPTSAVTLQAEELRAAQVTFWYPWSGQAVQVIQGLVDDFNAGNEWGIQVQAEGQSDYDRLFERVQSGLESGAGPNLAIAYPYQALSWGESGAPLDLEPYAQDPQWGLPTEEQEDFYPPFWQQPVVDGVRVGVPAARSGFALFYNQSWAEELGFNQAPRTLEQVQQQACAAAQALRQDADSQNDNQGGLILSSDYPAQLAWMHAFGAQVLGSQSDTYHFDTAKVEEAFRFQRSLYDQGCAWLSENDPPVGEFADRQGLIAVNSLASLEEQQQAFEQAGNNDHWLVLPFPSSSGEPVLETYGPSYVLLPGSPAQELASWLFVRWMSESENQAQLVEAMGTLPLSESSKKLLEPYRRSHPLWGQAVDLLPYAQEEPAQASWRLVRWSVFDAGTQLFRSYFSSDQIPQLVELLDQTAAELHDVEP